jgi:radical SAM protein with 4Fe4S-binding SPASM domain
MGSDCELPSGIARIDAMRRRAAAEGLPLHGTFALTHRCNFRCVHCYVLPGAGPVEAELSAAEWIGLAGEAAAAGCFSILLTGGEPLLRADFCEIYLGIRKLGIHVMLFTNASRVDETVVAALLAAPPRLIEVTVYGATSETYMAVTGRPSAFAESMRGIARLREAGLPVRLKTVLMQPTLRDFEAIRALRGAGEPPVRYDAVIQPRFPGDREVDKLRVPPAEVAELEARTIPELPAQWKAQHARQPPPDTAPGAPLYSCAAGGISFYVSAEGRVQPCVSAVRHGVPYRPGRLLEAFREVRQSIQAVRAPAAYRCAACGNRIFCGSCPPVAELECGRESGICAYACALAHERGNRMPKDVLSFAPEPANG